MNSEQLLKKMIKEEIRHIVWESECLLHTSRKENLTDILTGIRALGGVTIVTLVGASKAVSEFKEISKLKIKFVPSSLSPSVDAYIKHLSKKVRGLDGVFSFQVKTAINYQDKLDQERAERAKLQKLKGKLGG